MFHLTMINRKRLGFVFALLWLLSPSLASAQVALSNLELIGSSSLDIQYGSIIFNRTTNQTTYTATLKNTSSQNINGPIYLAVSGITPNTVTLVNPSGVSDEGSPYMLVNTTTLAPGQAVTTKVVFSNPSRARFNFTGKAYHTQRTQSVSVSVTSPLSGETVNSDSVIVNGSFQGPANVGITINGQVAAIQANGFYATVPLDWGDNTLSVTATTPDGQTATGTVTVNSSGVAPVKVESSPSGGVASLPVTFKLTNNTGRQLQSIAVDYDGDGTDDFTTTNPNAAFAFTYNTPGAYQAVFDTVDDQGASHISIAQVIVKDAAQMDTLFNSVWGGMKTALAANDQSKALDYLNQQAKEKYGPVFIKLAPQMPAIVNTFSPLQRVSISEHIGEYAVNYTLDGTNWIFLIYFLQDANGIWRLDSM